MIAGGFARRFAQSFATGPVGSRMMPGPLELFQKQNQAKLASFVKGHIVGTSSKPGMLDSYFGGRNITIEDGVVGYSEARHDLAKIRTRAGYILGGLAGANVMGLDPMGLTSATNNLARMAAHGAIGSSLYGMGGGARVAGMAYLGATALNTFRAGDNLGPM